MSYENNKSNLKVVVLGAVGALIAILAFKAYERSQQIAKVNKMFTSMNINAEVNFDGTVDVGENTYKLDGLDFVNTKTGKILSMLQLGQEMINVNKKPQPETYAAEEATTEHATTNEEDYEEEPNEIIIDPSIAQMDIANIKGFTILKYKDLPSWFEEDESRIYLLNDPRHFVDDELVEYIGGYVPNKGEIFFINNAAVVFTENQIKIDKERTIITKTFTSGPYTIEITWDTDLTTGAYSEGNINLFIKNENVFNSDVIIRGW